MDSTGRILGMGFGGNYQSVARFTAAGVLDSSFGSSGWVELPRYTANYECIQWDLSVQADDKVLVSGTAATWSWNSDFLLVRLLPAAVQTPVMQRLYVQQDALYGCELQA